MPNLSGLTRDQAKAAIQSSGLRFTGETSSSTGNQSLNDRVNSQSISAGTLIDYESEVSFVYLSYVAPVVTLVNTVTGSCQAYSSSTDSFCSGTTLITTITTFRERLITYYYSDGSSSSAYQECSALSSTNNVSNSATCGYVAPAPSCQASCGAYTWSACSGGSQTGTRTCIRTDCSTVTETTSRSCCTASCGSYTWGTCSSGSQRGTRTCTRSDCSTYTESDTRCCSQTVYGSWSSCSKGLQERVVTTYTSSCGSSSKLETRGCTTGGGGGGNLIAV